MIQGQRTEPQAVGPAIAQVYAKLPARDVERAKRFYAEKLGLEPCGERHTHLYYQLAGAYFIVFPAPETPPAHTTSSGWSSRTSKPKSPG